MSKNQPSITSFFKKKAPATATGDASSPGAAAGSPTTATAPATSNGNNSSDLASPSSAAKPTTTGEEAVDLTAESLESLPEKVKRLRVDVDAEEKDDAEVLAQKQAERDAQTNGGNDTDDEKEEDGENMGKGATVAPPAPSAGSEEPPKKKQRLDNGNAVAAPAPAAPVPVAGAGRRPRLAPKAIEDITATKMAQLFLFVGGEEGNKRLPAFDAYAKEALWPRADDARGTPYAFFVDYLADISGVSGRLVCTQMLTMCYWTLLVRSPQDLLPAVYLTVNKLAPAHEGIELGIGDALLIKAIADICGMTEKKVKEEYQRLGDLPEVAQAKKKSVSTLVKPKPLQLKDVFKTFKEIATSSGNKVQQKRCDLIRRLLRDAKGAEVNFLMRGLQGKMRIGLAETTVVNALAYAFCLYSYTAEELKKIKPEELQANLNLHSEQLATIQHQVPSFDLILPTLIASGLPTVLPTHLSLRPGLPVRPMLAHPTTGITKILDRFQGKAFTCEYKYDGERAQIHYDCVNFPKAPFSIFSRNSETHTTKYPDIIDMLPKSFNPEKKITSFIIDSEAVAVGPGGELQAFQVLQHRSRKNVELKDVTIPVCLFAFDLMYLNGENLLTKSLTERREILQEHFLPVQGRLRYAQSLDICEGNVDDILPFLNLSIADGCEGLMVKTLTEDAKYHPAKRSYSWLKLKKDYMEGCGDTLDLVPIGAYFGKGKRTGALGGFLLACYDPENDDYQSICKIGTGFKDDELEKFTASLVRVDDQPRNYRAATSLKPDVWLSDTQVWEIKAADLSISPVHLAAVGIVDEMKGIALRFPRFIRIREDKQPDNATSSTQVAEMYRAQALAAGNAPVNDDVE